MMLDHPSVWGYKSQGSNLEVPLNRKTGKNWPHHGAKKDTSEVMVLKAGASEKLAIVCGEAKGKAKEAAKICKAKSGKLRQSCSFNCAGADVFAIYRYPHGRWLCPLHRLQKRR